MCLAWAIRLGILLLYLLVPCLVHGKPCEDLGIDVTMTMFDSPIIINSLTWVDGPNGPDSVVFMLTADHQLWRSTDYGKSWNNEMSKLPESDEVSSLERDSYNSGPFAHGVRNIVKSSSANGTTVVYLQGVDGRFWSTRNQGETYNFTQVPNFHTFQLQASPRNPNVAIAFGETDGCFPSQTALCIEYLIGTTDGGLTWNVIRENIAAANPAGPNDYYYGNLMNLGFTSFFSNHENATDYSIMYLYYNNTMDNNLRYNTEAFYASLPMFIIERDFRNPSEDPIAVIPGVLWLAHSRNIVFYSPNFDELFVSYNGGATFDLIRIAPPPDVDAPIDIWPHSIIVADETVWLMIESWYYPQFTGDVYISQTRDEGNFTWILPNLYSFRNTRTGVAFAATYATRGSNRLHTWISFNRGGSWMRLTEPEFHMMNCTDCTLQIRPDKVFTEPSVPGIIVANGNLGPYLSTSTYQTFVSRDGGITWRQVVAPGQETFSEDTHVVLAEHGALLAYIYDKPDVDTIFFSLDHGQTFEMCQFSNATDHPDAIDLFSDPSGQTPYVFMVALVNQTHDALYWFNFTSLFPRDCQFPDDFELVTLTAPNGECIAGKRITYWRVKESSGCHEQDDIADLLIANETICECTALDFICDECFVSVNDSCQIHPLCTDHPAAPPDDCPENTTYLSPTGYRKLSTSFCVGGVDLTDGLIERECPMPQPPPPVDPPTEPPSDPPSDPPTDSPINEPNPSAAEPVDPPDVSSIPTPPSTTTPEPPSSAPNAVPSTPTPESTPEQTDLNEDSSLSAPQIASIIIGGLIIAIIIGAVLYFLTRKPPQSAATRVEVEEDAVL